MKILVIRNEPPWPLYYGGRLHCYELCRRLAGVHELLLVARRPGEDPQASFDFVCRVAQGGRLYAPDTGVRPGVRLGRLERFFGIDGGFVQDVLRLVEDWAPDVVIGMNYQSLSCLSRITGVPRICDLQDDEALHSLRELLAGCAKGKVLALKCLLAALLFQRRHIRKIEAVTVLSEADRRFCAAHTAHRRVVCIPHGVDCAHYAPRRGPEDRHLLSFWGSLTFGPNISAILFFAKRVWPRIRRHDPRLRWLILGRGGSPQLECLRHVPGIDLLGWVPDIRDHVARSAVAVVPMVCGAGIKNKIMEAWAMQKAVVCTPRAMGSLPGVHGRNAWIAGSPRKLAEGVIRLSEDADFRRRLAAGGRQTAVAHCSWDRAAAKLDALCRELAAPAVPAPAAARPGPGLAAAKEPCA